MRRLNKIITESYRKEYREIKMALLYKIVEVTELRFKSSAKLSEDIIELCRGKIGRKLGLKNELLMLEEEKEGSVRGEEKLRQLIVQIHCF